MKNISLIVAIMIYSSLLLAHDLGHSHAPLHHWTLNNTQSIEGSFYMYKNNEVFIQTDKHELVHYPLSAFTTSDQAFALEKEAWVKQINKPLDAISTPTVTSNHLLDYRMWLLGLLLATTGWYIYLYTKNGKTKHLYPILGMGILASLYGFTEKHIKTIQTTTSPTFIDSAFTPFKPNVYTRWDATYFYVESRGIPNHEMMTGITGWQQQFPTPQCYTDNNAWSIPLNPVIATTPVPVSAQHFTRGAIALAINGVPIFNPYTNTGVDAYLDGQLDIFGGHCGRADDYHYHIAPLQLYSQTTATLPIAFALDGIAIYGNTEPDGSPMQTLDANHGHYGTNGVYHYHGTATAPYMIANMVGQVTEDNTMQIIPQATASPFRPAGTPLQGAVITGCTPNATSNGYTLTYTLNNQNYSVEYSWTSTGLYTFNFISPTGTTTSTYNGTTCTLPTANEVVNTNDYNITLYPNPNNGILNILLDKNMLYSDIEAIALYNLRGDIVFQTEHYKPDTDLKHLGKGVYIVKVQIAGQQITQKLLIQ